MNLTRYRMTLAVIGLLASGPALAATLSVYSKMGGGVPTGAAAYAIGRVAPAAGSAATTINCATNAVTNCVDGTVVGASVVLLEPTLVTDAQFVNWSGCTSVAGNVCTVNFGASAAKTVTANFKPAMFALQLKTTPVVTTPAISPYGGALTAATEAIRNAGDPVVAAPLNCTSSTATPSCIGYVPNGTANFVITAVPNAVSKVASWTGCATSTATTCTIAAMLGPKTVSAVFGPSNIPVTAQVLGSGRVTLSSTPAATDAMVCGVVTLPAISDCAGAVSSGSNVTLTAAAVSGNTFMGWTGACTGASLTCTLSSVTSAKAVTATFKSSTCTSCHGAPPSTHSGTLASNCANCHTNYTVGTVDPAVHMDGEATATWNREVPPADFGLVFEIVAADRGDGASVKPTIDLKATDLDGTVIDLVAASTLPGGLFCQSTASCSGLPRFAFGEIQPDGSFRTKLGTTTETTSETAIAGRFSSLGGGVYRYTFSALLGRDLATQDPARTWRVATYGATYFRRTDTSTVMFPAYDWFDYVPAGGAATTTPKTTVADSACDACHGGLQVHGRRRGVQICLTCHNINTNLGSGATDTFKWDLKNLVHKLHSGKAYDGTRPDGVAGSAWSTTQSSFATAVTHMAMGPSHTTYFEGGATAPGATTTYPVTDAGIMGNECGICHQGTDAAFAFSKASRLACGSCHTSVNFQTGVGHDSIPPSMTVDDTLCAGCHPAVLVEKYHSPFYETAHNADFVGSGTLVYDGTSYPAIPAAGHDFQVQISSVTVNATTGAPTITTMAMLDGQPFDLVKGVTVTSGASNITKSNDPMGGRVSTCAFTIAGPTSDYVLPATGGTTISCAASGVSNLVNTATPGETTLTLGTFFAGKTGAYTVSYEIMYQRQITASDGALVRKPFAAKPNFLTVFRAATTDPWSTTVRGSGTPEDLTQSRRAVVTFDKCNACHVQLGFHSNRSRQGPDYCAECHNPKLDNGTRARVRVSEAYTTPLTGTAQVYLPESVSMNVFIHRIHMGDALPSVEVAAEASPWVPDPGRIVYGATRSGFVGVTATTPPEFAELTFFAMPSPMGRCDQCHISQGATKTWALNERTGQAPVERTFRVCAPLSPNPSWDPTVAWCNNTSTNGMPKTGAGLAAEVKVITPPMKAVCTSCHDSASADSHADGFTINPMSATAVERCAECHGAGMALDSLNVHEVIP